MIGNGGQLLAFQLGVDGTGTPSLAQVGASTSTWGYTSGSPVVTSDGTTAGSALVWAVYSSGSSGANGQLRAYSALPNANGTLPLKYSAPIGTAAKFSVPATERRTGVRRLARRQDLRLRPPGRSSAQRPSRPTSAASRSAVRRSATATITATRNVTVTGASAPAPFSADASALPVTLHAGESLQVPVTFAPTAPGVQSAALTITADAGSVRVRPARHRDAARHLRDADVPRLRRCAGDGQGVSERDDHQHQQGERDGDHRASHPAARSPPPDFPPSARTIAAGASVSVPVTFRPTTTGDATSSFRVVTNTGRVVVPLSGSGVAGAPHLTITPLHDGVRRRSRSAVRVTKTFDIENTGNLVLTITKAAPPAGEFGTTTPVSEGQQLSPGPGDPSGGHLRADEARQGDRART